MNETYLEHHGILGQKWGVRHGPPYPLDYNSHSSAEKSKNPRSRISSGGTSSKKRKTAGDRVTKLKKKTDYSNVPVKAASALGGSSENTVDAKEKLRRAMLHATATAAEIPKAIKRETSPEHEWDSIKIQRELAKEELKRVTSVRDRDIAKEKVANSHFEWTKRWNESDRKIASYKIQTSNRKIDSIINDSLKKGYNIEVRDVKRYAVSKKILDRWVYFGMPGALISMLTNRKEAWQDSKTYYVSRPKDYKSGQKGKLEEKDTAIPQAVIKKSLATPGSTTKKSSTSKVDLSNVQVKGASALGNFQMETPFKSSKTSTKKKDSTPAYAKPNGDWTTRSTGGWQLTELRDSGNRQEFEKALEIAKQNYEVVLDRKTNVYYLNPKTSSRSKKK